MLGVYLSTPGGSVELSTFEFTKKEIKKNSLSNKKGEILFNLWNKKQKLLYMGGTMPLCKEYYYNECSN